MVSIVALLLILSAMYFVVLFGTVAYQLTGLDWETAQFQALSAFTGAGFTTRASELVVNHRLRRRITTGLILFGYATTASVIATLVSSVAMHTPLETALNFVVLVACFAALMVLVRRRGLHLVLATPIRRWLTQRLSADTVPHEELLQYKPGYAISRIEIPTGSRLAGQRLRDANLRAFKLQILAIEDRDGMVNAIPDAEHVLVEGEHVLLYGVTRNVQDAFAPIEVSA